MSLVMVVFGAFPALAHHANITTGYQCDEGTGLWDITWTIRSDDEARGKEWKVKSATVSGPDSPTVTIQDPGIGVYQNESQAFTGITEGVAGGTYELEVYTAWTDDGPTNRQDTKAVTLPGEDQCRTVANPGASVAYQCDAGAAVVTLTNDGDESASFHVTSSNGVDTTVSVDATDSPETVQVPLAENESATVTVTTAGGSTTLVDEQVVERDCQTPAVSTETCSDAGDLVVTVSEAGTDTFTIVVDGDSLAAPVERTSEPGVSEYVQSFELSDGTYTVTVTSETGFTDSRSVTIDCDAPQVDVAQECIGGDGTVVVTVTEVPADDFVATLGDATVPVVDGQATFTDVADGNHTLTVTDGSEQVVHTEEVTVDCDVPPPPPPPEEPPAPEVDVTAECADEDGTVTVAVDGIRDGETLTITLDDQVRTVTSDGSVTFEDVADGEYTVVTTSSEGDVDQEDSVTVDCDVPPPPPEVDALNVECTDEGLTVIDLSEQPDVTGVTVDGEAIEVPEGGVLELDLPAGSHDIVITRSDADPITLTVDCPKPEEPEPTVEPTDEPTVEPTEEPTPAPTPQEPQVKGETIERELAATGASSGLLALAAAVLAGLGALMVVGTRSGATPGARLARAVTDAPPLPRRLFTSRVGPAIRFRGGLPSRAARGSARTVRRPGRWRHWRE